MLEDEDNSVSFVRIENYFTVYEVEPIRRKATS